MLALVHACACFRGVIGRASVLPFVCVLSSTISDDSNQGKPLRVVAFTHPPPSPQCLLSWFSGHGFLCHSALAADLFILGLPHCGPLMLQRKRGWELRPIASQ